MCVFVCLNYSLESNADQRSELDVHLSMRQVMAHVHRLHCLEGTNRGRSHVNTKQDYSLNL